MEESYIEEIELDESQMDRIRQTEENQAGGYVYRDMLRKYKSRENEIVATNKLETQLTDMSEENSRSASMSKQNSRSTNMSRQTSRSTNMSRQNSRSTNADISEHEDEDNLISNMEGENKRVSEQNMSGNTDLHSTNLDKPD
ncbi:8330_t:CDS:2 [Dentiscutata erythropus]|uniref:8330_t:CDS:1 n=1 Tax=Dentiscutata erythropus TaxID=1348616 RepID=A0A9N9G3N7_9GLOM|nr:8330_t:CDS:2 [Dentiscutata erythropus]